jgi:hypothetical protein
MNITAAPRETELIGLTADGRMMLWSTEMVQPIDSFETTAGGRWNKSGHYVIDWHGHSIAVHCGNFTNGNVAVQFMCGALEAVSMSRTSVEELLLGEVIPDPVVAAEISRKLQELGTWARAQYDKPHLQRGRIT